MPVIKLTLEYDGRNYHGWQRQVRLPTVQAAVESGLRTITGRPVQVTAAGRTDAGVHALGQVASFRTAKQLSPETWRRALNAWLPADIAVTKVAMTPGTFHARRSAIGKRYDYRLLLRASRPALLAGRMWHLPYALSLPAMRRAMRVLVGRREFAGFQSSDPKRPPGRSTVCHLRQCRIISTPPLLTFSFEGDRYLHHMVRTMVGTIVEIGRGRWPVNRINEILDSNDRRLAGPPAPAEGLYLVSVRYPRRYGT